MALVEVNSQSHSSLNAHQPHFAALLFSYSTVLILPSFPDPVTDLVTLVLLLPTVPNMTE
jgi:hypothetical protein